MWKTCALVALGASGCGRIGFEPLAEDGGLSAPADADQAAPEHPVTELAVGASDPSLAWTGTGFGLSWDQQGVVHVRLLDRGARPAGEVRSIGSAPESQRPSLAWTGTGFGLSWDAVVDGEQAVLFATLDASGAPLGPAQRLSESPGDARDARLIWLGDGFAVAWWSASGNVEQIEVALLSAAGALQQRISLGSSGADADDPDLAAAGGELGLAWEDDGDSVTRLQFARYDTAGNLSESSSPVTDTSAPANAVSVAASSGGWLLAFEQGGELRVARLSQDGAVLASGDSLGPGFEPALTVAGPLAVLGWQDLPDGDFATTRVVALDGTGLAAEAPIQLGSEAGTSDLDLEWADGLLAAAWEDRRHGDGTVYVRLLAP